VILHVLLVAVLTWLALGSAIAGGVLACLCWSVVRGWVDDRDRVRRIRQCVLLADVDAHDDALVRTLAEIQSLPIANS
jgi:UDP-N-acetylmuramyl pentapeptide phosphotransferase/UDP-N-acetylglucosamine-1-phosphate transferase